MNDQFRPLPVPGLDDPAENFLVASKMSPLVSGAYSEAYAYEFATDPAALARFGTPTVFASEPSAIRAAQDIQEGGVGVIDALRSRRSLPIFDDGRPVAGQILYRVLDEAAGITTTYGRGTPSPGALYPLDCYVTVANVEGVRAGFYGYDPYHHRLVPLNVTRDPREWLISVLAYQDLAGTAAFHVFTVASFDRVRVKYGQRAYRFALIEAGHLVQSMLLIAEAEGVGGCTVGGFFDRDVDTTFGLDGVTASAVHSAAFGHPIEIS
nr:SagB family peptide dehydrogenase [Microbacterium testaceum]